MGVGAFGPNNQALNVGLYILKHRLSTVSVTEFYVYSQYKDSLTNNKRRQKSSYFPSLLYLAALAEYCKLGKGVCAEYCHKYMNLLKTLNQSKHIHC